MVRNYKFCNFCLNKLRLVSDTILIQFCKYRSAFYSCFRRKMSLMVRIGRDFYFRLNNKFSLSTLYGDLERTKMFLPSLFTPIPPLTIFTALIQIINRSLKFLTQIAAKLWQILLNYLSPYKYDYLKKCY